MNRYRVVMSCGGCHIGSNYIAETAQKAVNQARAEQRKIDPTFGGLVSFEPDPKYPRPYISKVYELAEVHDWK